MKRPDRFGPRRLSIIIALEVVMLVLAILTAAWGMWGLTAVVVYVVLGCLLVVLGPRGFAVIRPSPPRQPGTKPQQ